MAVSQSSRLDPFLRAELLATAARAIEVRLSGRVAVVPELGRMRAELRSPRASFVTLTVAGALRGCCGSLEASRPLVLDVWSNAQESAFHDPRFEPLASREWPQVRIEVSVLSPLERMTVRDEAELRGQLEPGTDGLVLAWGGSRATFLPKVWEQFREPTEFLAQLKRKAGWHPGFWAPDLEVWRYTTEEFAEALVAGRQEAVDT